MAYPYISVFLILYHDIPEAAMNSHIEKYIQKTNTIINEVAEALHAPGDTDKALRALRVVLHALRNRLTTEENLELVAQLPMLLKGLYVDGWSLRLQPVRIRHIIDFIDEVRWTGGDVWDNDFPDEDSTLDAITAVFSVLKHHVSAGEIRHIIDVLPRELKQLWTESFS